MESALLRNLGIPAFDIAYALIAIVVLLLISIILIIVIAVQGKKIKRLGRRIDALCTGADGQSLEEELGKIIEDNNYLIKLTGEQKSHIKNLYKKLEHSYQKKCLLRYNAFHQLGGEMSFVLVMLDEKDNGFMVNSVHSENGCYVYSKDIVRGQTEVELGEEEKRALSMAIESDSKR